MRVRGDEDPCKIVGLGSRDDREPVPVLGRGAVLRLPIKNKAGVNGWTVDLAGGALNYGLRGRLSVESSEPRNAAVLATF